MKAAYHAAGYGHENQTDKQIVAACADMNKKQDIQARILELTQELKDASITKALYTREEVIEGLLHNANAASAAIPVLDTKGQPTGEYRAQFGPSNKSWELLGRELGMFAVVHHNKNEDMDPLENANADAVISVIEKAAKKLGVEVDADGLRAAVGLGPSEERRESSGEREIQRPPALRAVSEAG